MKLALILLGAGNAKRFGENKLLLPVEGAPMGFHALRLFSNCEFAHRIYVTQASYETLWNEAKRLNYLVTVNRDPSRGVSSSIAIGLRVLAMQGGFLDDGVLFAVSDQPRLKESSVNRLIDAFIKDPTRIYALSHGDCVGNPVIFPQKLVTELMKLKGDVGGKQVIKNHQELLTPVEAESMEELDDIDEKK